MILFITILIGACLALSPYFLTKIETVIENRKNKPTMYFIVNNTDRRDPKIVDSADNYTDAVYALRSLYRVMPHMSLNVEKV